MITKEYLVNPKAWFELDNLIFSNQERYYLSIENDRHIFLYNFNNKWSFRKLEIDKDGNKQYYKIDMEKSQAEKFIPKTIGNPIIYSEYRLPVKTGGAECRLLLFKEKLHPLMIAKFKFQNEDQLTNFTKPDFCLKEITDDPQFSQHNLCTLSYEDLDIPMKKHLEDCEKYMSKTDHMMELADVKHKQVFAFFSYHLSLFGESGIPLVQEYTDNYSKTLAESFLENHSDFFESNTNIKNFRRELLKRGANSGDGSTRFFRHLYQKMEEKFKREEKENI